MAVFGKAVRFGRTQRIRRVGGYGGGGYHDPGLTPGLYADVAKPLYEVSDGNQGQLQLSPGHGHEGQTGHEAGDRGWHSCSTFIVAVPIQKGIIYRSNLKREAGSAYD